MKVKSWSFNKHIQTPFAFATSLVVGQNGVKALDATPEGLIITMTTGARYIVRGEQVGTLDDEAQGAPVKKAG